MAAKVTEAGLLASFCTDINALIYTNHPLTFTHILNLTELRLKSTAHLVQTLEAKYGVLSKLHGPLEPYLTSACTLVCTYVPVHANLIVRELAFRVHFGGMSLDHSLLSRYLAVGLTSPAWYGDETLSRVAEEVYQNCLKESNEANKCSAVVRQLVRCAFIQDDGLFTCLWRVYSKQLQRTLAFNKRTANETVAANYIQESEEALSLIGRVCAHHGTHAMTMQVAELCSRNGFGGAVPFDDFVERFTALPQTHAELTDMLLHCKLVSPFALLERAIPMVAISAAHDMVAQVICGCVAFIRTRMHNKDRINGISYKKWLMSHTFSCALENETLTRRDLKALGAMWVSALSRRTKMRAEAASAPTQHRHLELRQGLSMKCGALVQIGLRLSMLAPCTTLRNADDPLNQDLLVWAFLCRNIAHSPLRMRLLERWWPHVASPWVSVKVGISLRAGLPSNAVGFLVHMRLYEEMQAIARLPRRVSAQQERVQGAYVSIALCRAALLDGHMHELQGLISAHPPESQWISRAWVLETAAEIHTESSNEDMAEVLTIYEGLTDACALDLFSEALRRGLPLLADATFSGDKADILAVHTQGETAIDTRSLAFCQRLDTSCALDISSVYKALEADDPLALAKLVTLWPPLATETVSIEAWQKLRTTYAPWSLNKQRSLASYRKSPENVFVAAVRLQRMACVDWLLTVPDLLCEFGRNADGHSILCESLWRELGDTCETLLATHAVAIGRCERACAPQHMQSLLKRRRSPGNTTPGPS